MSKARLTRQELGWLLTQEAQGAAERLRTGVQILRTSVPPPAPDPAVDPPLVGLDATLDALDDAMKMLSSIHSGGTNVRGRRGRVDLAALLWEVAPDARVSIEPGSGTEVFGDESELRRMLHVMVGRGGGVGSAVTIKREGDDVRLAVVLGPDSSASVDTERAWISRMAIRYGGRYELDGATEALSLPADGVSEKKEREALEKELSEAKKQGELYARELAAVLSGGEEPAVASSRPPALLPGHGGDRLHVAARLSGGIAAELRSILAAPLKAVRGPAAPGASTAPAAPEDAEMVRRGLMRAQELVASLARVGEIDAAELAQSVDVVESVRTIRAALSGRLEKGEVTLRIVAAPDNGALVRAAARASNVMLREIIDQAVMATPRGGEIDVSIEADPAGGFRVAIDDPGPPLPAAVRRGVVALELEPSTYGRPTSVGLYIASEIASAFGYELLLGDAPRGGLRVMVRFPRGV